MRPWAWLCRFLPHRWTTLNEHGRICWWHCARCGQPKPISTLR